LGSRLLQLSKNVTIYGLGDVAVSIVNFFLFGLYVKYFSVVDYGTINLLLSLEVLAKIVFRFGLDGSFLRFLYECRDRADQQRLASTIVLFLIGVDGLVIAALMAGSAPLARAALGSTAHVAALRLMLFNTFLIGFTFIPFSMLQMEQRATLFSSMTLFRSVATIILRLVLVIRGNLGIEGLYIADLIVTVSTLMILSRWFFPLIRPVINRQVLRETLAFGLPRLPHAAAQQVIAVGDKFVLKLFVSMDAIGIYGIGVSFGLIQKLFLSAFQSAWAPFIFETANEPDAAPVFRTVTTYGVALLALLTAGLSAIGGDLAQVMTHGRLLAPNDPRWADLRTVVIWTAIGVFLQGVYLVTSIGLNITKKTQYYPVATIAAAGTNIGLNFLLIPRYGIVGAAWANGAAYAVQAGLGFVFSQRFYPIAYEWGRLARCAIAAVVAYAAARLLPSIQITSDIRSTWAHVPDVLARGSVVVIVFLGLLAATRFFRPHEREHLRRLRRRRPRLARAGAATESVEQAGEIVSAELQESHAAPDSPDVPATKERPNPPR
jgi:O-antigen/teichoic acid export membrane protein